MQDYKTFSDPDLVSLLSQGDHVAYTEIYHRYVKLMLNFAYKKLGDEELAKDFVQELFTSLWQKRDTLLVTGNLSAYLYISLRSKILDHFAHQQVAGKYITALKYALSHQTYAPTDVLASERSMNAYLESQILTLPTKMRVVFELSRKEHLSHQDIAERLATTENNVAKHITNALKLLRAKLTYWLF